MEDWIFENPNSVTICGGIRKVEGWIGRQIKVPSGIIDLLGYCRSETLLWPVVIELKNTEFTQASILQVCRYSYDITKICDEYMNMELIRTGDRDNIKIWSNPVKIVIAKGQPSSQIQFEADSVDVLLKNFEVAYTGKVSGSYYFNEEYQEKEKSIILNLLNTGIFDTSKYAKEPEKISSGAENG